MPTETTTRPLGAADEALLAAEKEIAALRQKQADLVAAGDHCDHPEITDRVGDLETLICNIPPNSMTGAVVKLRQLVDDLDASTPCEGDDQSVRQILALVEREIAPGEACSAKPDAALPAPDASAPNQPAFALVFEMEAPVADAKAFADVVAMLAETIDDQQDGAAFQRVAWEIIDRCKAIECRRGKLFRLLHPNHDHFEKVGWPDDTPTDREGGAA